MYRACERGLDGFLSGGFAKGQGLMFFFNAHIGLEGGCAKCVLIGMD